MMAKRAVVLEVSKTHVGLLTGDGAFLRLSACRLSRPCQVGEEIFLPANSLGNGLLLRLVAIAACLLLIFMPPVSGRPGLSYVVFDGNISIELTVDNHNQVIQITPLGSSAEAFLKGDPGLGHLSSVMDRIITWAENQGDNEILITVVGTRSQVYYRETVAELGARHSSTRLVYVASSMEVLSQSRELGIGLGRALLLGGAIDHGYNFSDDDIQRGNLMSKLTAMGADLDEIVMYISPVSIQPHLIYTASDYYKRAKPVPDEVDSPDPVDESSSQTSTTEARTPPCSNQADSVAPVADESPDQDSTDNAAEEDISYSPVDQPNPFSPPEPAEEAKSPGKSYGRGNNKGYDKEDKGNDEGNSNGNEKGNTNGNDRGSDKGSDKDNGKGNNDNGKGQGNIKSEVSANGVGVGKGR